MIPSSAVLPAESEMGWYLLLAGAKYQHCESNFGIQRISINQVIFNPFTSVSGTGNHR